MTWCGFDEELIQEEWYTETSARLIDKGGRFIWSATPQAGTEKLFALHERAEDQVEKGMNPKTVEEFYCTIVNNKYMTEADRELFIAKHVEDENTYNVRVMGGFAMLSGRVYPEYTPRSYEIDPFAIPPDWTRYVAIDPGRQVCAVLFGAVPPPEFGDFFYIYDELYIKDCTAAIFGQEMGKKTGDQTFYTFLIDMSDAKRRETGTGLRIVTQYSEQLKLNRVSSLMTGNEFEVGSANVESGIMAVRHWLRFRSDDTAKIKVFRTCKNFSKEAMHYRNQQIKVQGQFQFIDKPVKKRDHLMDCLRYLVQRDPIWVKPRMGQTRATGAYAQYLKMNKDRDERQRMSGGSTMVLGPKSYADAD